MARRWQVTMVASKGGKQDEESGAEVSRDEHTGPICYTMRKGQLRTWGAIFFSHENCDVSAKAKQSLSPGPRRDGESGQREIAITHQYRHHRDDGPACPICAAVGCLDGALSLFPIFILKKTRLSIEILIEKVPNK